MSVQDTGHIVLVAVMLLDLQVMKQNGMVRIRQLQGPLCLETAAELLPLNAFSTIV